jgi:hypothetical protein
MIVVRMEIIIILNGFNLEEILFLQYPQQLYHVDIKEI